MMCYFFVGRNKNFPFQRKYPDMKKILLTISFLAVSWNCAYAQTLSLSSAIQIAQQQSYDAMVARLSFMSQYWSYRSFRAEMNLSGNTLELSASDRIWELILYTILEIAELISADASKLLSAVIDANPRFHKLYQMYKLVA